MGPSPTIFFLILGVVLMVLELVVPGLVVVFLGAAALVAAAGLYLGLIGGWMAAFTTWFVASIVLVLGVRSAFTRFLPGTFSKQLTDEDVEAFGQTAVVVEEVTAKGGRIRFRGTTWAAQSLEEVLPVGTTVRIATRDNLSWIVEPVDGWEALPPPPAPAKEEDLP